MDLLTVGLFVTCMVFGSRAGPLVQEQQQGEELSLKGKRTNSLGISQHSGIQVVPEYGSLSLECEFKGIAPASIYWTKDGHRISPVVEIEAEIGALQPSVANGTPTRLSTTKAKLQNDCITAANEGMYSCVGENNLAEQVQHTLVKVAVVNVMDRPQCQDASSLQAFAPNIYIWTKTKLQVVGGSTRLICRAEGNPKPKVTWMRQDGSVISSDSHYQLASNGDLVIYAITWQDRGLYNCKADNQFGSDIISAFLYPMESPAA